MAQGVGTGIAGTERLGEDERGLKPIDGLVEALLPHGNETQIAQNTCLLPCILSGPCGQKCFVIGSASVRIPLLVHIKSALSARHITEKLRLLRLCQLFSYAQAFLCFIEPLRVILSEASDQHLPRWKVTVNQRGRKNSVYKEKRVVVRTPQHH